MSTINNKVLESFRKKLSNDQLIELFNLLNRINFKFNQIKKDFNCGMGFVNPNSMINQHSLGHSQS